MPRPKGLPKTGGRQKGTPNKATAAKAAEIAASGLTPLDYMLSVLRDETKEPAVRLDAARAAAPYVHPRLSAVEHTGKDGGPVTLEREPLSDFELARRIAFMLSRPELTGQPLTVIEGGRSEDDGNGTADAS